MTIMKNMKKLALFVKLSASFLCCASISLSFYCQLYASSLISEHQNPIWETECTCDSVIKYAESKGIKLFEQSKLPTEKQTLAYACNGNEEMLQKVIKAVKMEKDILNDMYKRLRVAIDQYGTSGTQVCPKDEIRLKFYKRDRPLDEYFKTLNTMAVLIFNTICCNKKCDFSTGVHEMAYTLITEYIYSNCPECNIFDKINIDKYQKGLKYITALVFYNMILNHWQLKNCWTFAQNFEHAFNSLRQFFGNVPESTINDTYNDIRKLCFENVGILIHLDVSIFFNRHLKQLVLKRLFIYTGVKYNSNRLDVINEIITDSQIKLVKIFNSINKDGRDSGENFVRNLHKIKDNCQIFSLYPNKPTKYNHPEIKNVAGLLLGNLSLNTVGSDMAIKTIRYIPDITGLVYRSKGNNKIMLSDLGQQLSRDLSIEGYEKFYRQKFDIIREVFARLGEQEKKSTIDKLNESLKDSGTTGEEYLMNIINKSFDLRYVCTSTGADLLTQLINKFGLMEVFEKILSDFRWSTNLAVPVKFKWFLDSRFYKAVEEMRPSLENSRSALSEYYGNFKKKYKFNGRRQMKNTEEVTEMIKNIFESIEIFCLKNWYLPDKNWVKKH